MMKVTIVDTGGLPIPGAAARETSESGTYINEGFQAAADNNGMLDLPDDFQFVTFSSIGFTSDTMLLDEVPALVTLEESNTALNTVTITAAAPQPYNYSWILWTAIGIAFLTGLYLIFFKPNLIK